MRTDVQLVARYPPPPCLTTTFLLLTCFSSFRSTLCAYLFCRLKKATPGEDPEEGCRRRYSLPFSACSFAYSLPDILPYPRACLCLLQAHFCPLFTLSCTLSNTLFPLHYRLLCQDFSGLSSANHTAQTCNRSPTIAPPSQSVLWSLSHVFLFVFQRCLRRTFF
jgi:hypothetical protein